MPKQLITVSVRYADVASGDNTTEGKWHATIVLYQGAETHVFMPGEASAKALAEELRSLPKRTLQVYAELEDRTSPRGTDYESANITVDDLESALDALEAGHPPVAPVQVAEVEEPVAPVTTDDDVPF